MCIRDRPYIILISIVKLHEVTNSLLYFKYLLYFNKIIYLLFMIVYTPKCVNYFTRLQADVYKRQQYRSDGSLPGLRAVHAV